MLIKFLVCLAFFIFVVMNIEHYISQLLYRYSCVTVPGFGAFLTDTLSTTIHENNHTFFPPKKVVFFNTHIKNNDGLLANHIAQVEGISYNDAVNAIEKEVKIWLEKLQRRDFLIFKNIGLLQYNAENHIVFEPYEHTNYLTESFGLYSFVSPTIKREVLKVVTQEESLPEEEYVAEEVVLRRNPFVTFFKYAAIVTVSLGASGFGYATYINQQEQAETLMVQKEVQKEVQSKIQEATFFIQNPVNPVVLNTKENTLPFHIMAGAFRSEANAQKEFDKLIEKGYKARLLEKNDLGLYPVVYGSFATYTEAQYKLTQIQQQENEDAWLLIKEL